MKFKRGFLLGLASMSLIGGLSSCGSNGFLPTELFPNGGVPTEGIPSGGTPSENIPTEGVDQKYEIYKLAVKSGYSGSYEEWLNSIRGEDGLSAYEIYKKYHPGYNKSEEEWISDLVNGNLKETYNFIYFNSNGGSYVDEIKVVHDGYLTSSLPVPVKQGYIFDGWYYNGTKFNTGMRITSDIVLEARWRGDSSTSAELKTVSMFGGTDPHAYEYEQCLKEFGETHGVNIIDNSATADEVWKTSVISSFYSGTEPDVLFFFTGNAAKPLVDNNMVVSIEEIRSVYPNYARNINPTVMNPYCVPIKGFVEGMYVNTALLTGNLEQYASKDSWTWDEFMAVCEGIKTKGKTPVALGAQDVPHYWIEHLILNFVGKEGFRNIPTEAEIDMATGKGNTNADKWIKALQMMNTLANQGVFGSSKAAQMNQDANNLFLGGEAAIILDGSWFAYQIDNPGHQGGYRNTVAKQDKVKMIPFPAIPSKLGGRNVSSLQGGFTSGYYISRKAWNDPKKRDLAVKLVEKMTSTSTIGKFCKAAGGVPADNNAVIDGLSNTQKSFNTMLNRVQEYTMPLSDVCKPVSFSYLVSSSDAYLRNDLQGIKDALKRFAAAQK